MTNMALGSRFNPAALRALRKESKENQTEFWSKFGVTQSRGSRFELGTEIPCCVAILLSLYMEGVISDVDLQFDVRNSEDG